MYTKEDIDQLAGDFEQCRKILLALGDENTSFQTGSIPSSANSEGCRNIESEKGSN